MLNDLIKRIKKSELWLHETKRSVLLRFIGVILIIVFYFTFISFKYGLKKGFLITLLSWSFFVFCTPIADAGSLFDFPLRLLTHIRMIYSEMLVWTFAFLLNVFTLKFLPNTYNKTGLLKLFKYIIFHPWPFWTIILLSAMGTYLSVYFGDELLDVASHSERKKFKKHKNKYLLIIIAFLFLLIILFYDALLQRLGIKI